MGDLGYMLGTMVRMAMTIIAVINVTAMLHVTLALSDKGIGNMVIKRVRGTLSVTVLLHITVAIS